MSRVEPACGRLAAIDVSYAIEPAQGQVAASMQFRQKANHGCGIDRAR
jgi:hypothetical protein